MISQSDGQYMQAETSVIAGPNGTVCVAWIDIDYQGTSTIGYAFSKDDGVTFSPPVQIQSPEGRLAGDPALAIDASGSIYATWLAFHQSGGGDPTSMRIYVAVAPAGSTSFGAPVEVSEPMDGNALYDKPWITVTNAGAVLVTYERDMSPNEFGLVAARSVDGGVTWQRSFIVNDPQGNAFRNLAFPCAPRNGSHVWATFVALDGNGLGIKLARSDDDGVTWLPEVLVNKPDESVAFDDPTCVADADNVWISYGLSVDPLDPMSATLQKLTSTQLAYSSDAGKSIATRSEALDAAAGPYALLPQLALEESGALDIVYYAGIGDEDSYGSYRRARAPAATGFNASTAVELPLTFLQARGDPRWLGDYTGVNWRAGGLYTSYVVNTTGTSQVAFAKYATP